MGDYSETYGWTGPQHLKPRAPTGLLAEVQPFS